MADLVAVFKETASRQLVDIQEALLALVEGDTEARDRAFRVVHTLKGDAGMLGMDGVLAAASELEDLLSREAEVDDLLAAAAALAGSLPSGNVVPVAPRAEGPVADLDDLSNAATELAILRNRLTATGMDDQDLDRIVNRVYAGVMGLRMQEVAPVLQRVRITAITTARALGKDVDVVLNDGQVSLERSHFGPVGEVLGHLARNAIDHGIESADERHAAGKPLRGRLAVTCDVDGDDALISVDDDGRGLDLERLAALAPDLDATEAIFQVGVSTKRSVSATSGRGVGLDAVQDALRSIGGTISVESKAGAGTRFTLRIPRRLSLQPCVPVRIGESRQLVPLPQIQRISSDDRIVVHGVEGSQLVVDHVDGIIAVAVEPVPRWLRQDNWLGLALLPDGDPAPVVRLD